MSKGGTTSTTMESGRGARSGNAILITFFTSPRLSPDAVSLEREEIALLNAIHPPLKHIFYSVGVAVGVAVFGRRFIPGVRDRTKLSFKKYTQRLCTDTDMSVRDRILMVSNGSSLALLCSLFFGARELPPVRK